MLRYVPEEVTLPAEEVDERCRLIWLLSLHSVHIQTFRCTDDNTALQACVSLTHDHIFIYFLILHLGYWLRRKRK